MGDNKIKREVIHGFFWGEFFFFLPYFDSKLALWLLMDTFG